MHDPYEVPVRYKYKGKRDLRPVLLRQPVVESKFCGLEMKQQMPVQLAQRLYILQIENIPGLFKIGISKNVKSRVAELQTGVPYEIKHIASIQLLNGPDLESELHMRYQDLHVRGEWYKLFEHHFEDLKEEFPDHFRLHSNPEF